MFLFTSRLGSGMTRRAIYNIFEDAAFACVRIDVLAAALLRSDASARGQM